MRLQKLLSAAGVASRRAAEQLIRAGRVSVNGHVVQTLGTRADPEQDDVRVDGQRVRSRAAHRYLLLYKPVGYVTTRRDPQHRPTVMALLGQLPTYVYPVGRLDYDSEGLLLFTNDGELAARLMHPRHEIPRVYEARVWGVPAATALNELARGVPLGASRRAPGPARRTAPARVRVLHRSRTRRGDQSLLEIAIREGRQRQVRSMCQAVGHPVITLKRTRIGPIADRRLKPGAWRELTTAEVRELRRTVDLDT
ncbi:MAG: pseudouridine synthase [Luteitalea sp.]|nr:pseudouridine synthase [Luteitalea sp.]